MVALGPDYVFYEDRNSAGRYYVRSRIGNIVAVDTNLKTPIDALKASGVWFHFTAGNFDFGTISAAGERTTFNTLDDITITGEGVDATTLQNTSTIAQDTEVISCTNCSGWTLRDFTTVAAGSARSTSDALDFDNGDYITLERIKITDTRGSALAFDGKDGGATSIGHTIRDVEITYAEYEGILCWAVTDSLFENLKVSGFGVTSSAQGLKFNRHSGGLCEDNTIRGGIFDGGQYPIAVWAGTGNVIDGAIVQNGSSDGLRFQTFSDGFAGLDNSAINVRARDNGGYGIRIIEDAAATITNTRIGNISYSGNTSGTLLDGGTTTVTFG